MPRIKTLRTPSDVRLVAITREQRDALHPARKNDYALRVAWDSAAPASTLRDRIAAVIKHETMGAYGGAYGAEVVDAVLGVLGLDPKADA